MTWLTFSLGQRRTSLPVPLTVRGNSTNALAAHGSLTILVEIIKTPAPLIPSGHRATDGGGRGFTNCWNIAKCKTKAQLRCACKQARSQVLTFDGANYFFGGQYFSFFVCLKQIFLGTTKLGGNKKIWRALPPNATPWLRASMQGFAAKHVSTCEFHLVHGTRKFGKGKGVRKVGLPPHLSLIFCENFISCAREINCFRIILFVNLSTKCKYHGMNLHANFKEHCKWAKKQ